jgi:hypothetical protein
MTAVRRSNTTGTTRLCGDLGNTNRYGQPCRGFLVPGGMGCRRHTSEKERKAAAQAAVLHGALKEWGLQPGEVIDPGETFLALIAQASRRVQRYSELLGNAVMRVAEITAAEDGRTVDRGSLQAVEDVFAHGEIAGLLAPQYELDMFGTRIKIGEQIRALTKLEADERDRLAKWCQQAIAAGLEERRVRLAEQQGAQLAAVIRAFVADLGLTAQQQALVPAALRAAVTTVFGASPARMIEGQTV